MTKKSKFTFYIFLTLFISLIITVNYLEIYKTTTKQEEQNKQLVVKLSGLTVSKGAKDLIEKAGGSVE